MYDAGLGKNADFDDLDPLLAEAGGWSTCT